MSMTASQITSLTIVYSTVYSDSDQRKHQSSASLAFVWGIHRGPVNSPHKWPVTRKMFPFDDVIMGCRVSRALWFASSNWSFRTSPATSVQRSVLPCPGSRGHRRRKIHDGAKHEGPTVALAEASHRQHQTAVHTRLLSCE